MREEVRASYGEGFRAPSLTQLYGGISSSTSNGNVISGSITSGDLGGLLSARSQVINPALNQLGQIATALSQTVNAQQGDGLDLSGNLGANIFSVGAPLGTSSSKNTDAVAASVSVNANGLGALTADNYLLSFQGGTPNERARPDQADK